MNKQVVKFDQPRSTEQLASRPHQLPQQIGPATTDADVFQNIRLTGTLAHELRSPLSAIATAAFLINHKAAKSGLDIIEPYKRIENSLKKCNDVIATLLDKSWADQLQPIELDIDEWLAKIVRKFASHAPKSVELDCEFSIGGKPILFDPVRLETAVTQILDNALDALIEDAERGAGPTDETPTIILRSQRAQNGVLISIANNGPCIAEDKLQSIIEPWFSTKAFGTGLGLALVKWILELHGGCLKVKNLSPHGVVFTCRIDSELRAN